MDKQVCKFCKKPLTRGKHSSLTMCRNPECQLNKGGVSAMGVMRDALREINAKA